MRIVSVRQGFDCDHSSYGYHFVSKGRISPEIESLLEEEDVNFRRESNTITFRSPRDGYISSEVEDELLRRKDIILLILEEFDWWNLFIMFEYDEELYRRLERYRSEEGDYIIYVKRMDDRIKILAVTELDYTQVVKGGMDIFKTLRELLLEARSMILEGEYEPMEILHAYCTDVDLSSIPHCTEVGEKLKSYLTRWYDQ